MGKIDERGVWLVAGSALAWSFGGAIARYLHVGDSWLIVFWRSLFAAAFLLSFMLYRQGLRSTWRLFATMGLPGLGVAVCFAIASTCFVVALSYTTVANVLLMQAGVPLIAALLGFLIFKEAVSKATWVAIGCVIAGIAIMVSSSLDGNVSPIGDGLALLIAVMFAVATVITRHHANVEMMPAVFLGCAIAALVAGGKVTGFAVSSLDLGLLAIFGAVNLGLGMALFVTGARLIPAALAALLGTGEPVLGPLWVWLLHGELPGGRTLLGGAIVCIALVVHIGMQFGSQRQRENA